MIDTRVQSVTELLRQTRDITAQLHEILAPEIVSYEIIRGDIERKRNELKKLDEDMSLAKIKIEKSNDMAKKIIETANEEAAKKIDLGNKDFTAKVSEANLLLDSCKQFALDVDKARYLKLREDAEKASAI